MKSIFITGSTGFVGKNTVNHFNSKFDFHSLKKNEKININQDIVLHFAGKAHDLKNTSNVQEYYAVNTELTKKIYDDFLLSDAKLFITLSSVKACADSLGAGIVCEPSNANALKEAILSLYTYSEKKEYPWDCKDKNIMNFFLVDQSF